MESILRGKNLPLFKEFARYLFYTATGEEFNENTVNEKTGFIGEIKNHEVYLYYKPDVEWLKKNALTLKAGNEIKSILTSLQRRKVKAKKITMTKFMFWKQKAFT
jgi:adenine-specific DNA-methyltransferase